MRVLRTAGIGLSALAFVCLAATLAMADGPTGGKRSAGPSGYGMPSIWTGLYGGVHIGSVDTGVDDSFVGGVQLGYNWQVGSIIYGVEGDLSLSGSDHAHWLASARGRLGYLIQPRILLYGTAGLGFVNNDETDTGFVYGVGIEGKLSNRMSARLEYLEFSNDNGHHSDGASVIRAGLNIKLGY